MLIFVHFPAGSDYDRVLDPNTMIFEPGGPTRVCARAHIIRDKIEEHYPEDFHVELSLIPTDRVTVNPLRARVMIYDALCE